VGRDGWGNHDLSWNRKDHRWIDEKSLKGGVHYHQLLPSTSGNNTVEAKIRPFPWKREVKSKKYPRHGEQKGGSRRAQGNSAGIRTLGPPWLASGTTGVTARALRKKKKEEGERGKVPALESYRGFTEKQGDITETPGTSRAGQDTTEPTGKNVNPGLRDHTRKKPPSRGPGTSIGYYLRKQRSGDRQAEEGNS